MLVNLTLTLIDLILWKSPTWDICAHGTVSGFYSWVQLLEGWLALNPGLNLTHVSFPFSQKHFLGQFSLIFIKHRIINLLTKRTKLNIVYKLSYLNSNFALTLGYLNRGGRKGLRYCGIALFLVRCCGNFCFKVRYCGFQSPSGVR